MKSKKCNEHECNCAQEHEEKCACGEDCTCGDDCNCGDDCTCGNAEEKAHTDKLNEAYNKVSELEDALLRSKAEFINYRKRLEEETTRMLKFSNEGIVKEILPIIDNFERAIKIELEDDELLKGFNMVYGNLVSVLNKYDVKEIDCLDKPFDPMMHQAVIQEAREGVEEGIVIEVLQKGYTLKEKVIRPAMVRVSQ